MKPKLFILFSLLSLNLFGQTGGTTISEDFNKDGYTDTLRSYYDGGSGFGGIYAGLTDGKTGEVFEMSTAACFCALKIVSLIPPELNKLENSSFLKAIKDEILPPERQSPDPSLKWIIESSFSNYKPDQNTFFDLIIDPQLNWEKGVPELPDIYYMPVQGDTLSKLYSGEDMPEHINPEENHGFLIYYGHNHYRSLSGDSLRLADENKTYQIYMTSHGILAKKGDAYKWLFLSDIDISGAPEKLRWESIGDINLIGKYMIVKQNLPPFDSYSIYVLNIETGICGRLKYDFQDTNDYDENDNFVIHKNTVIINTNGTGETIKLKTIFKALEKSYFNKITFRKNE